MAVHNPIERGRGVVDCSCGHRQVGTYVADFGARVGFLEHLVSAIAAEQDWPEAYSVDGTPATTDLTAAVEAGARAWHDRQQAQRRDTGRLRPDGQPWQWEDLTPIDKHALRSLVLPIVTAALNA